MNLQLPRILAVVLVLLAFRVPSGAEEDWEKELKPLFELYADGMNGRRYGDFLAACDMSSRSLFRELTLYEMSLMPAEELRTVLPWDDEDHPVPLEELVRMTNDEFWSVYLKWMKRHQEATAQLFADRMENSPIGRPTYVLVAMTRKEDSAYMIVDRRYKPESPIPVPLMVVEAVREGGRWKLKLPREILWDAMEQARARKIAAEEEEAAEKEKKDGQDRHGDDDGHGHHDGHDHDRKDRGK